MCGLDAIGGFGRDFVRFGVHHVAFERFAMNGLERTKADVQSKFADFHAPRANFLQNFC